MDFKVSCIMIGKNLLSQGYPFVEAIESVIPFCSEIIISEGFSTDGTYEILEKMQRGLGSFMKIYRRKWYGKRKMGNVFASEFNFVKGKCSGRYILRLDPDHIFDPETLKELELIARLRPEVDIFSLPYITFTGQYVFKYIWASNFFRNKNHIASKKDSGSWGYTLRAIPNLMISYLARPDKFLRAVGSGTAKFRYYAYLTKPVFHYHAVFPGNYLERIKQHQKYYTAYDWTNYQKVFPLLEAQDDWHKFWDTVVAEIYNKQAHYQKAYPICGKYEGYPPHPLIMKHIWGNWTYSPAGNVLLSSANRMRKSGDDKKVKKNHL